MNPKKTTAALLGPVRRGFSALAAIVASAMFWLAVFGLSGAAMVSAGVGVQFGAGYALISAGVFLTVYAAIILRGITSG